MCDRARLEAENAAKHERMLTEAKVQADVRLEKATKKDLENMLLTLLENMIIFFTYLLME